MLTITIEQLLIIRVREISLVIRGSVTLTPATHTQYMRHTHSTCDTHAIDSSVCEIYAVHNK